MILILSDSTDGMTFIAGLVIVIGPTNTTTDCLAPDFSTNVDDDDNTEDRADDADGDTDNEGGDAIITTFIAITFSRIVMD